MNQRQTLTDREPVIEQTFVDQLFLFFILWFGFVAHLCDIVEFESL